MNDPTAKARWVLGKYDIMDIPAMSLKSIAAQEKIKCQFDDFADDIWLAGMLLYKGEKRKIIVNTHINNTGRHNFTFAHELGHYFMDHPPSYNEDGMSGFRCTSEDIDKEIKPREVEANRFAGEFLMPESRFRLDMAGAPMDFGLINSLANRYMVSKQSCARRILEFTHSPCIIIYTRGTGVTSWITSRSVRGFLKKADVVPTETEAYAVITSRLWQDDFSPCNADKWLSRTIPGNEIYECTHIHRESGTATTILRW